MLIHVVPQLYLPIHGPFTRVRLLSAAIPETGWQHEESALYVGRPYPNKGYRVGCASKPAKAALGLLVETDTFMPRYTTIMEWEVDGVTVKHIVEHTVLDTEHDAVSDLMVLRYGSDEWQSRYPNIYHDKSPLMVQPVADILPAALGGTVRGGDTQDTIGGNGLIQERLERFSVPTIERWRLTFPAEEAFDIGPLPSLVDHQTVSTPPGAPHAHR